MIAFPRSGRSTSSALPTLAPYPVEGGSVGEKNRPPHPVGYDDDVMVKRLVPLWLVLGCAGPEPRDAPPTWSSEMTDVDAGQFQTRAQPEGAVDRNVADADAEDGLVATLRFPGIPALGNADRVSPQYATELATTSETFRYGTYWMRVKLAACAPGEEVV